MSGMSRLERRRGAFIAYADRFQGEPGFVMPWWIDEPSEKELATAKRGLPKDLGEVAVRLCGLSGVEVSVDHTAREYWKT